MISATESHLLIAITFIWIGFVCAISFMEAWLKFRAPGVTLAIGLSIGKIVFNVLNKIEILFALVILFLMFNSVNPLLNSQNIYFLVPFIILLIQTTLLLPVLHSRAQAHIEGQPVKTSFLHIYYVGLEFIKVICLIIFGITHFK